MKRDHTTTRNLMTYIRIIGVLVFSVFFVLLTPFYGEGLVDFLVSHSLNLGILYAIIVGFMMSIAIDRRRSLEEQIYLELNKIRRIYHLSLHIKRAQPKLQPWFDEMRDSIKVYLNLFKDVGFQTYEKGSPLFRSITYAIYSLPKRGISYNADLYASLLSASGSVTEAREYIRAKKNNYIGYFQWFVMIMITLTFSAALTAFSPFDFQSRVVTVIVVFDVFLVLDLLLEYDRSNENKNREIASLYAHNLDGAEEYK